MTDFLQSQSQSQRRMLASKRDLRSHLLSIMVDSAVVDEVFDFLEPLGMPCIANLRNGLWYSERRFHGECYFKSTDGHHGQWNFSIARLNLTLAKLVIDKGGALIVDSTKQGKRFPDSFTATIPIWCAIVNYVVLHPSEQAREEVAKHMEALLCTPEWVDKATRERIVTKCVSMTLDLPSSAVALIATTISQACKGQPFRALRPVWVCPDADGSIEWEGDDAEALLEACMDHELEFSDVCGQCRGSRGRLEEARPIAHATKSHGLSFTPLVLLSVSGARNSVNYASAGGRGIAVVEDFLGNVTLDEEADGDVEGGDYTHSSVHSWEYVPGAGDDEESWAQGLTAEVFWDHVEYLMGGQHDTEEDVGCNANALLEHRVAMLLSSEGKGLNKQQNEDEVQIGARTGAKLGRVGDSHVYVCTKPLDRVKVTAGRQTGDRAIVVISKDEEMSAIRSENKDIHAKGEPLPLLLALSCDKQSKGLNRWGPALARAAALGVSRDAGGKTIIYAESEVSLDSVVAVAVALYGATRADTSTTAKLQARTDLALVHAALGRELYPPRWVMREVGVFLDARRGEMERKEEEEGEEGEK